MTGEHEPIVDREPIKENSCNEVIEIDSSSDSDEDMPSRPRRRLRSHRYNVYSDSGVEMEEANETEEPENKPKLPLPTPPPFHPVTKAPNIAMPGEGYDPTFVWELWAILDRANYEKPNEAYLVQWCDKEHRFCATWVWATILFEDGFGKEMLRIDKWTDQYGHLTYAQFNKRFPSPYKASADGKYFFKALRIACHVVGGTDIVPLPLIEGFEDMLNKDAAKKGEELEEGVSLGVIKKFLAFLRSRRAPLACNVFSKNQLNRSVTSFEGHCEFKLNPGAYVVGAACARQIKHCFVLRVYGDKRPRRVFDRWYEDGEDDDFYDEPLENLLWIRRCHFIFRFERVGKVVRKRTTIKKKKLAKE
ncbi:hypothetical protein PI124_g8315 [Phytophthora idaei]|nr:hypothetical protein PI124_g8315 [Phytophthora idaei]